MFKKTDWINELGEVFYSKTDNIKRLFDPDKGFLYLNNTSRCVRLHYTTTFPDRLSRLDRGYWIDLLLASKNNELPSTIELAELIQLSAKRTYLLQRRLRELGMVRKIGKRSFANPIYGFHGKWMSRELYEVFSDDLDKLLPSWVQKSFRTL